MKIPVFHNLIFFSIGFVVGCILISAIMTIQNNSIKTEEFNITNSMIPITNGHPVFTIDGINRPIVITIDGYACNTIVGDGVRISIINSTIKIHGIPIKSGEELSQPLIMKDVLGIVDEYGRTINCTPFSESVGLLGDNIGDKQYFDLSLALIDGGTASVHNLQWFCNGKKCSE